MPRPSRSCGALARYTVRMAEPYLTDHLLIAMPALGDPNFVRSVTLICQHDADGAMGIVINRQGDYTVGDLFGQLDIVCDSSEMKARRVLSGGPVQPERGFVLHGDGSRWNSTLHIGEQLSVTTSRDILAALARGDGPADTLVTLGYAGWDAGQLEAELAENSWLTAPASHEILFRTPLEQRWQAAARAVGIDLSRLTDYAGHA